MTAMTTLTGLRTRIGGWRREGLRVGLVPTMGALHDGHLELVRLAGRNADRIVVSIFVNPAQFAPHEDYDRYPRDLAGDMAKLAGAGCHGVWAPERHVMYPQGFATKVVPEGAALGLESDFRPHFFAGVATVCTKLFTQAGPDVAVFGEKDYQQLCVIRQVVRDLDLAVDIIGAPIVREMDGLAMSSRNRYLDGRQRSIANALHGALLQAAQQARGGAAGLDVLERQAKEAVLAAGFDRVDYIAFRAADSLAQPVQGRDDPLRLLAAAWLGKTRLIDNVAV